MYTILINEDNTMAATQKQRIIQRSKLVDDFQFLVYPTYNNKDMTGSTVLMEYLKPVSKEYKTEILVLAEDMYKDYLKYVLPVDTEFTKEAGTLKVQLSFIYVDIDADGNVIQRVRKIAPRLEVEVIPIEAWSDIIPDSALSSIDQRLIKADAQIKAIADLANVFDLTKADNIVYNEETKELQLMAGTTAIGDAVSLEDLEDDIDEYGVPVIELGSEGSGEETYIEDNVIEF